MLKLSLLAVVLALVLSNAFDSGKTRLQLYADETIFRNIPSFSSVRVVYSHHHCDIDISKLRDLKGRAGVWNGYDSDHPFDHFPYPSDGDWWVGIETASGPQMWVWREKDNNTDALVFLFRDMQKGASVDGQHNGMHHFAWWGAVPLNQLEAAVNGC